MADELTTVLLRFENPASDAALDDVGGLNPLVPAFGSMPATALATATALGYGAFAAGYLFEDVAGDPVSAFGAPSPLAATALSYSNPGPLGDKAIGFTTNGANAVGGAGDFDVIATDDLVIVVVAKWSALPAVFGAAIQKTSAAFAQGYAISGGAGAAYQFLAGAGGASSSSVGATFMLGQWHVAIAAIDRATGKMCFGVKPLGGGAATVGALASIAGTLTNAGAFSVGSGAWVGGHQEYQIAGMWVGKGTGVAAGIPANMATALANFSAALMTGRPTVETGIAGNAAVFAVGAALQAGDQTTGATALPRDVTVQALVRWDIAAQNTSTKPGTIIARGRGDVLAEYMPFALELYVLDPVAKTAIVRWLWQTAAGVLKTEIGAGFICPTGYMLLTATRRWISPTSVVLRYYIGDQLLAEVASADGDIASSASGTTTVGARFVSPSMTNFLCGAIDELRVLNYEMSREEISALWYRLSIAGPDGKRQIADLLPPGLPISSDPSSRAQSDLASIGQALGFADGLIENVRQNIMPDRAYGEIARRWEGITQQPAQLADGLDTRRKRVLGHLGSRLGVSAPGVDAALATVLACLPTDLAIYSFDATYRDAFATLDTQRWFLPNAGADVIGNELRLQIGNGLAAAWDETHPGWGGAISAMLPCNSRPNRSRALLRAVSVAMLGRLDIRTLPTGCEAGVVLTSWVNDSRIFLGVRNTAGTFNVGYQIYKLGLQVTAWTQIALGPFANPVNLRMMTPTGSGSFIGQIDEAPIAVASTDAASPWTEAQWLADQVSGLAIRGDMDWFGVYLRTYGASVAGSAGDVRFLNTSAFRDQNSDRAFYWYAYRNPALPGSPDFAGANRIVNRMRHGYTVAAAISSLSCNADDPNSLADLTPCGAL